LGAGATLAFDNADATGVNVDFADTAGGTLLLSDSQEFGATIHGFGGSGTDKIDLTNIIFISAGFQLSYSGSTTQGVLTVTDGTRTAHLTMFGNYTTASFHPSADSFNGTAIVDPPAQPTPLAFGH
jgi:hypothetical protein